MSLVWRLIALSIFLAWLPTLNWPDIPKPVLDLITNAFKTGYWFNTFLPVDTFLIFFGFALGIEIGLLAIRLMSIPLGAISGNMFTFSGIKGRLNKE